MADPTIQTFCCYTITNATYTTSSILKEFNPRAYNVVSIFSSALGLLGALYQVYTIAKILGWSNYKKKKFFQLLPRRQFSRNHRWISFSAERGRRIVLWLALTDLLASLGKMNVLLNICHIFFHVNKKLSKIKQNLNLL